MRRFTSIVCFLCVFMILLSLFDFCHGEAFLLRKGLISNRDLIVAKLETEEPDEIDVLFVGNSLGMCSANPMELYKNTGITAYNACTAMQMPVETYYVVKKALRRYPIKVILWEANNIPKGSKDLVDGASALLAEVLKYHHPFIKYHSAWRKKIDGFVPRPSFKGYVINEVIEPYTGGEYYNPDDTRVREIAGEGALYFDRVKKLCDENHIQLVLYSDPSPLCYDSSSHNGIIQFAKEKGVDYLDGDADLEQIGIDWSKDTFDEGDHLNLTGTNKMTAYLGRYLAGKYDLEDHRNDAAYGDWNELYLAYEKEVVRLEGTAYYRLEAEDKD